MSGERMVPHLVTAQALPAFWNPAMSAQRRRNPGQRMVGVHGVAGVAALRDGPVLERQLSRQDGLRTPGAADQASQNADAQRRHAPDDEAAPAGRLRTGRHGGTG